MLKIRLRRQGSKNNPFYRIVLSDSRLTPRASTVEELGYYDPTKSPAVVSLKEDRIDHWVSEGAQMSDTVAKLRSKSGQEETGSAAAPEAKKAEEAQKAEKAEAAPAAAEPEAAAEEPAAEEPAAEEPAAAEPKAEAEASGEEE